MRNVDFYTIHIIPLQEADDIIICPCKGIFVYGRLHFLACFVCNKGIFGLQKKKLDNKI